MYNNFFINYSLLSIFAVIPLIFSHFFSRLGEGFIIENGIGSYESVKVSIFGILLFCATLESLFKKNFVTKKTLFLSLGIIIFLILENIFFGPMSFFGLGEKQHGTLIVAWGIWFGYLCSHIGKNERHHYIHTIIVTSLVIAAIALIEFMFRYNIITGSYLGDYQSWGIRRSMSTLGNPNYLAGYLIMVLPLVSYIKHLGRRYAAIILLSFGIISSGSFIGIAITLLFFLFLLLRIFSKKYGNQIFFLVSILCVSFVFIEFQDSEKWLSLVSRFILMRETLFSFDQSLFSLLFGNGPNAIIDFYEGIRSESINAYFPSDMIIDSAHNLLIDFFMKYGIIGFALLILYLRKNWGELESPFRQSIILGICFFFLNVAILSAYLLFLFGLTQKSKGQ